MLWPVARFKNARILGLSTVRPLAPSGATSPSVTHRSWTRARTSTGGPRAAGAGGAGPVAGAASAAVRASRASSPRPLEIRVLLPFAAPSSIQDAPRNAFDPLENH